MEKLKDLKQVERKSFLTYFNDGVLEIVVGIIIIGIYVWLKIDVPALVGAWAAVGLSLWALLKRVISAPRIGLVNFKGENEIRKKRSKQLFMIGLGMFLIVGVLLFQLKENLGPRFTDPFHTLPMLPFYLICLMGLIILAASIKLTRYWIMAALLAIIGLVSPLFNSDGLTGFLIFGIAFLGLGIGLMVKFMKDYPKPQPER